MNIMHSSLDKQTTATLESDAREISCSGNVSYGNVSTERNGSKNEDEKNEHEYEYLQ